MGLPARIDTVTDRIERGAMSVETPEIDRKLDRLEASPHDRGGAVRGAPGRRRSSTRRSACSESS
jgi:hypothetical protein